MLMKNMLDNGKIIYKMELVFIFILKIKENLKCLEIDFLENGKMEKDVVMEFFIILMEVFMKVFGKMIKKMVLEL